MFAGYRTLEIFMDKTGEHRIFDKYEINICSIIRHKKTKIIRTKLLTNDGYHRVSIYDNNGKRHAISVARIMLSTFVGPPPTDTHTADHRRSKEKNNNNLINLRWYDKPSQRKNQDRPKTHNDAVVICHDGREQTAKEWAVEKGVKYKTIKIWARTKNDWSYKQYNDLPDEIWKLVIKSKNTQGFWMVSNLSRAAYHTVYTRKVYYAHELKRLSGYPSLSFNNLPRYLHDIVFEAFHPKEFANMKPGERILHKHDDRLDCCIDHLRIGDASMNGKDAHDNGKYDGTKSQRRKCFAISIETNERYEFESLNAATQWLKDNGHPKATRSSIIRCLSGKRHKAYGFIWKTENMF